jgi:hypothetical protein
MTYVDVKVDGEQEATWDFADELAVKNWTPDAAGNTAQTSDAKARMLWTEKYLYVLVTAVDTEIDTKNEAEYKQDSVEVFFDEHNYKEEYGKHNEFQYRQVIDPSKAGALTDKQYWDGDDIQSAVKKTDTGYVCEFAIPFKDKPVNKSFVGVEVQINDAKGGDRVGTWNLFANPAGGDATPYESTTVFGDCQLMIKTEKDEKTVNLNTEDSIELLLPAQFRKVKTDSNGETVYEVGADGKEVLDGEGNKVPVYEVDENGKYVPQDDYSEMNTKAYFDAEKGVVYCETANNVIFYIPDKFKVEKGDTVDVEIKGTYETTKTTDDDGNETEVDNGFRIWLVDTVGKPDPEHPDKRLSSDSAATTSDQFSYTKADGLELNDKNEFTVKKTLESREDEKDRSDGTSTALMIKASSWNGMIGKLTITSIKITVNKPVVNNEQKEEQEEKNRREWRRCKVKLIIFSCII